MLAILVLARMGRADVIVRELRERWANMQSVVINHTLQEDWQARPDSTDQWSHCAVAPIYLLFMDIAGIRATAPGFAHCEIRPQLADLGDLELTYYTVRGPIQFTAKRQPAGHEVTIRLPAGCNAELLMANASGIPLPGAITGSSVGTQTISIGGSSGECVCRNPKERIMARSDAPDISGIDCLQVRNPTRDAAMAAMCD